MLISKVFSKILQFRKSVMVDEVNIRLRFCATLQSMVKTKLVWLIPTQILTISEWANQNSYNDDTPKPRSEFQTFTLD